MAHFLGIKPKPPKPPKPGEPAAPAPSPRSPDWNPDKEDLGDLVRRLGIAPGRPFNIG